MSIRSRGENLCQMVSNSFVLWLSVCKWKVWRGQRGSVPMHMPLIPTVYGWCYHSCILRQCFYCWVTSCLDTIHFPKLHPSVSLSLSLSLTLSLSLSPSLSLSLPLFFFFCYGFFWVLKIEEFYIYISLEIY